MSKKSRIEVVDSLRGFAIMGILLLHSIEHFNFYLFPKKETQPAWLNSLDDKVWDTLFFMFGGKGYAIFALLFGFTFSLMYLKQISLGKDFGTKFLWRMLLLAGFAFVNGLFFPGEVLLMYAIVGCVLYLVRNLKNVYLVCIAVLLLSQPIEWAKYLYHLFNESYVPMGLNLKPYWLYIREGQLSDSLFTLMKNNTLNGHKVSLLWAYNVGRLIQTAGLFVLGFLLGKKGLFNSTEENTGFWKTTFVVALSVFIVCYYMVDFTLFLKETDSLKHSIFVAVKMYRNLAFTFVLVSSFILLYQVKLTNKLLKGLRYCGRMSLTAYVFQSLIGSYVFFGYGLGLGPNIRHTISFLVGILLFVIQFYFCKIWIQKYGQGPLEKLWHKLTWLKF